MTLKQNKTTTKQEDNAHTHLFPLNFVIITSITMKEEGELANSSNKNSFSALESMKETIDSLGDDREQPTRLKQPLIWIDLEMTGLDVETDQILQIACIITDGALNKIIRGEEISIHYEEDVLQNMNDWSRDMHGKTGLTQAVRESTVSLAEAEQRVLEFIQKHIPEPGTCQIAGNSVHVDVSFMKKHMPRITEYAHYRIVDVSSVGELCRRWYPRQYGKAPQKKNAHTAMSDILESIAQLKYYKTAIFK